MRLLSISMTPSATRIVGGAVRSAGAGPVGIPAGPPVGRLLRNSHGGMAAEGAGSPPEGDGWRLRPQGRQNQIPICIRFCRTAFEQRAVA